MARAQGRSGTGRAHAELRAKHDVGPLVIHTSYLVNVCSQTDEVREKSIDAFRGEIERALTWARSIWCCIRDRGRGSRATRD